MKNLKSIIKYLNSHEIEGWISGGTARDLLLNRPFNEIHVSVRANFSTLNKNIKDRVIKINKLHNYISIYYNEITYLLHPLTKTTLKNTYPTYEFTDNLEEDAKSRDFTINSMYYNPLTNAWIDYLGGREDCKNKVIKFIGDWKDKILESKVRLLRGPVLCGILGKGWTLDYNTSVAIKSYNLKLMASPASLINKEMKKLFTIVEKPSKVFNLLRQHDLLTPLFHELTLCIGIDQSQKREHLDLYTHIMYALDAVPTSNTSVELVRLAALLHDIGKPQTEVISPEGRHFFNHEIVGKNMASIVLQRWGYSTAVIKKVQHLIEHHLFNITASNSKTAIKKFISRATPELVHELLDLRISDIKGAGIAKSTFPVESLRRKINSELMKVSPKDFKLALNKNEIQNIIKDNTEEDLLESTIVECQNFLKNKIFLSRTHNKKPNLKKALKIINKITCPLDRTHLFKTWTDIQTGQADKFDDGKLKCGVYCNFNCDKILKK